MKYRIDKASKTPAYEQLYRLLRADIAEGVLPPRYKLPSKRFLAAELEIAVITVEHAYELLCDEGYAVSRPRSGYYVAYGAEGLTAGAPRATQAQMRISLFPCLQKPCAAFFRAATGAFL